MTFKSTSITPLSSSSDSRNFRSISNRMGNDRTKNPRNLAGKSPFANMGSYMIQKNRKLQDQFNADAASSSSSSSAAASIGADSVYGGARKGIFAGISIFVDGFTIPSSQELKGYMLKHGGKYQNYFSRRNVTHIICTHLPDRKMKNLRAFSRGLPIVKPEWVLDSVTANRLLNWVHYQLDTLKNESGKKQKLISFYTTRSIKGVSNAESPSHASSHSDAMPCEDEKLKDILLDEGECSESKEQLAFLEYDTVFQPEDAKRHSTDLGTAHKRKRIEINADCVKKERFEEPLHMFYPEFSNQKQEMGFKEIGTRQIQLSSRSGGFEMNKFLGQPQSIMPQSASQIDYSVLMELPEELKADILDSLPPHTELGFSRSTSENLLNNFPDEIKEQTARSKVYLWTGTPPNWVEKFKLSNSCLLNAFAKLYSRSETNGILSVVLGSSNSFLSTADDNNYEEWDETVSSLYELLKQYVELKIESDIEELFVCFRLLRRCAIISKVVLQAYNLVLPFLQASLSESYGGTFKLSGIEELEEKP